MRFKVNATSLQETHDPIRTQFRFDPGSHRIGVTLGLNAVLGEPHANGVWGSLWGITTLESGSGKTSLKWGLGV